MRKILDEDARGGSDVCEEFEGCKSQRTMTVGKQGKSLMAGLGNMDLF
jgi:hypothetical protein